MAGKRKSARGIIATALALVALAAVAAGLPLAFRLVDSPNPTDPLARIGQQASPGDADESSSAPPPTGLEVIDEDAVIDHDTGMRYVATEVIVMATTTATDADMDELAGSYNATVENNIESVGFYLFKFSETMTTAEVEALIEKLNNEPTVEEAFFNTVFETEDSADADDVEVIDNPNDPWDGDVDGDYKEDAPRGSNWGMEAIKAHSAWALMPEVSSVNIGLIDSMVDKSHEDLNVTIHQSVAGGEYPAADDHGTAVAGIMAATADNGKGPVGVTSTAAMLHYGVTENALALSAYSRAFGYIVDLIALIDEDVKVVNISENTSRLIGFAADRGNENARKYLQQSAKIVEAALARRISSGSEFILCMAAGNNNNLSYTKNEGATYGWEKSNKGESGNVDAKYNNFINLIENETVKSHIVVVGSIGIDDAKSTDSRTGYAYSRFSNVGARVDIVGPGERIYSTVVDGYGTTIRADGKVYSMDGTSFSAPHVSGVAALIFACNPNLTGAEVKRILVDSTSQEFYYHQGHSGLIDAEMAVRNALRSRHQSVEQVTANRNGGNLDLCFVVDTTGSMGDDIDNAKENMDRILDAVTAKSPGYRVALVDYRDYPDRTNDSSDYPAKTQLAFSSDVGTIKNAIQALDLGYGGDDPETVYSGLMRAIGLDWRPEAKKVIIIIGDAPPHDPEPNTGYTYDQTLAALYSADIGISTEDSDYDRIFGSMEVSEISVFAIGADASDAAATFLEELAMDTQGSFEDVEEAADISRALIDSIEQIELAPTQDALASFDPLLAGSRIELYRDDEYVLDFPLDEDGARELVRMEIGEYRWVSPKYGASGALEIEEGADSASVTTRTDPVDPAAANTYSRSTTVALFVSCVCLFVIFGLSSALVLALKRR